MRLPRPLWAVLGAVVVAGCGGGGGTSDEDQIRRAVDGYAQAISGKQPRKLCDVLITKNLLDASKEDRAKQFESCRRRVGRQRFRGLPGPHRVKVDHVEVSGDKATARVRTTAAGQSNSSTVQFRRVDDRWRILTGS
jgi:hypothetical protein